MPAGGARELTASAIRSQVDRILRSDGFAQAAMLRRLLQYLTEKALQGVDSHVKEYGIGVDVFDRGSDFDPRTDTIVRAQVRRLRAKLVDYYGREGAGDPIVVRVPKGRYTIACEAVSPTIPAEFAASRQSSPSLTEAAIDGAQAARGGTSAIVVLPFLNLSGDDENEYFTDGLTDEITSRLAAVAALRVVARTSAFQFKGRSDDVRKIGRDLGVQTVLEGSVRRDGERIRVTAQLIDVADGFHLWSHIYDGELPGVFGLQEKTTRSIVEALRIRLAAEDHDRLRPSAPSSLQAYDLYLKALSAFYKATGPHLEACLRDLERAMALDPDFAAAHALVAEACLLWSTVGDRPAPHLINRARQAAHRALELQDVAEAHAAMASVLAMSWEWDAAEAEFRRALSLKPSYAYARMTYTVACLCPLRRYDEAIEQMRLALAVDPLSPFVRTVMGQTLALAGRAREAVEELHRALVLAPDFVFARYTLGFAYLVTKSYAQAIATLQPVEHLALKIPNCGGHLGHAYARNGNLREAQRLLKSLLGHFTDEWAPWIDIAAIYAGLGQASRAVEWLERGYEHRCFDALFIRDDPRFERLYEEPRFRSLIERAGVIQSSRAAHAT
jgi:serine/threonine-protein kinase